MMNILSCIAMLAACMVPLAAACAADVPILPQQPFQANLQGWERQGEAEFALAPAQTREGRTAAQITVAPGVELKWQQLHRDVLRDVLPGDELRASAWVRTRETLEAPGAYIALEFLGDQGQRVGIAHSRMGTGVGSKDWEQLIASGTAPNGTRGIRLSLVLNAHGTAWFADPEVVRTGRLVPWPDLGNAVRSVTVRTGDVVQARFGGVGFHAFHHAFPATPDDLNNVIYKRWRELNPSFVRMNHDYTWDHAKLDEVAYHILQMKRTGTEVYLTTWNPPVVHTDAERAAYAKHVADSLEYLVRTKGCTNIHYYCMTNELSLGRWGALAGDLPTFKAYHQALFDEFKARRLNIGLLATDASPVGMWNTIEWAAKNMDGITAIYGGHHYINEHTLDDERFYPWFYERTHWATGLARAHGKQFVLGEFGAKQDGRTINGMLMDACVYWNSPQEPLVPIQIADAVIAAMNAGVYAMGYWTYMDFPDNPQSGYANKWGLFKCSGDDRSTRSIYYAYGLLTRYFRGPATIYAVNVNDPRLRVAAARNLDTGAWSFAVLNRNKEAAPLQLNIDGMPVQAAFRKYVYDPAHVPQNPFGDLQAPAAKVAMRAGRLSDTVAAGTLAVYTTGYDERPPAAVAGVRVQTGADGKDHVSWQANAEPDLCYYRVYRARTAAFTSDLTTQIGSTIATSFTAGAAGGPWHYHIVAVDQSGNSGR